MVTLEDLMIPYRNTVTAMILPPSKDLSVMKMTLNVWVHNLYVHAHMVQMVRDQPIPPNVGNFLEYYLLFTLTQFSLIVFSSHSNRALFRFIRWACATLQSAYAIAVFFLLHIHRRFEFATKIRHKHNYTYVVGSFIFILSSRQSFDVLKLERMGSQFHSSFLVVTMRRYYYRRRWCQKSFVHIFPW